MILIDATIKYKGYSPLDLSKGSHKRICVSCDGCGRVRYIGFKDYNNVCASCSQIGKKNHRYDIKVSNETRKKMSQSQLIISKHGKNHHLYGKSQPLEQRINKSCSHLNINIKDWNGFKNRNHVLREYKCVTLNNRFESSEGHHITPKVIVYLPKDLHQSIRHNLKTGNNMKEINELSLQYLITGGL